MSTTTTVEAAPHAHDARVPTPAAEVEIILNAAAGAGVKEAARARLAELFAAAGVSARVLLARGGISFIGLAESNREPLLEHGSEHFGAPNHHSYQVARGGFNCQRQSAVRPGARENVEDAQAILHKPGIFPGIDHRSRFPAIETLAHE